MPSTELSLGLPVELLMSPSLYLVVGCVDSCLVLAENPESGVALLGR